MDLANEMSKRLSFIAEWYQEEAAMTRNFTIYLYLLDNAIEIFENRNKKMFLRRTKIKGISERDFFVGSKINIFGRQFNIIDYADDTTRHTLARNRKKTFILLKSSVMPELAAILCALTDSKFGINKCLMVQFTPDLAKAFLEENNKGDVQTSVLMHELAQGPSIGMQLIADGAVEKIKYCLHQSQECRPADVPVGLLTFFENQTIRSGMYCAQSEEDATRNTDFFFNPKRGLNVCCTLTNSTLCIIKPHAIREGNLGKIVREITDNGFKITGMRTHLLERANCEEFYEIYHDVLPEYVPMVTQLASGVCMALEIVCKIPKRHSYEEFREFCGPTDPELAKLVRPHTLRAKFGETKVMNAVHCTDLLEDTITELEYMFKIVK